MSRGSMVACRCGPGWYSDRNSGPAVRPAIRRGSRCAVSVPHVIHMVSPPLTVTRACLLDRSRSSTFRASTAPAREADSYSIRHKNFSKIAEPSRVAPCLPATSPSSSPTRVQRSINSSSSTTRATTSRLLHGQTAVNSHRHGEHRRAPTFAEHPRMIHSGHPADDPAEDHPRLRLVTASLPTGRVEPHLSHVLVGQRVTRPGGGGDSGVEQVEEVALALAPVPEQPHGQRREHAARGHQLGNCGRIRAPRQLVPTGRHIRPVAGQPLDRPLPADRPQPDRPVETAGGQDRPAGEGGPRPPPHGERLDKYLLDTGSPPLVWGTGRGTDVRTRLFSGT